MYEIFCITFKSSGCGPVELRVVHAPTAGPRLLQHLAALRFLTVLQQLIAVDSEQKSDARAYSLPFSERGTSPCRCLQFQQQVVFPWKSVVVLMMSDDEVMMAEG
jgi:hypothetical protein